MSPATLPVSRSIYSVPVIEIDPTGGLRPLDQAWVEALMMLMGRDGQETPIKVHRRAQGFGMIAGRHRLAAARGLGWTLIDAEVDDELNGIGRRASEVSENLFRLGLAPLDRAAFVAEQIAIERERAGVATDANLKSVIATARWQDRIGSEADDASVTLTLAYGFTDQVAEKVGLSRKTIYRDLELHRGIRPDVAETIRTLPVAQNASQLRALAKLPEADQRLVAGLIVEGSAKGVSDALGTLRQKPVKSPAQKAWSAILGNWSRLTSRGQTDMLRHLGEAGLPKGVTLIIDGETFGAGK